jgi:alkanesulfonate monooxygenase SsuD/methylene tetrahydromethanopterin reductase-like flavin-dependent oxidoreductase (luciferase family)
MKAYKASVTQKLKEYGRDPASCKVLYLIGPLLGETKEDAQELLRRRNAFAEQNVEYSLARLGWITNIDFSRMDLDAPVGELTTNGHQESLRQFLTKAGKRTLREAMLDYSTSGQSVDLVGTPDQVAGQMEEIMQEVGGDGFLLSMPNVSRRTTAEICDGLIPALQKRGVVRKQYAHKQFRDNLLEF